MWKIPNVCKLLPFFQSNDPLDGLEGEEGEGETVVEAPTTVRITGKKAFRRYIRGSGIKLAVLRALVALYEEENKPNDALRFICKQMGAGLPNFEDLRSLQDQVAALRVKIDELETDNECLRSILEPADLGKEEEEEDPELKSLFERLVLPRGSYLDLDLSWGKGQSVEEPLDDLEDDEEEFEDEGMLSNENEASSNEEEEGQSQNQGTPEDVGEHSPSPANAK